MPITLIVTGVILLSEAASTTLYVLGLILIILGIIDLLVAHQRHPPTYTQSFGKHPIFDDEIRERKKNVFRANYYYDVKKATYKCEVDREQDRMTIVVRVLNPKTKQWQFVLSFNPPAFYSNRKNVYKYLQANWGEFQS